jgi:lipopolysaccharide transport system permease protein
MSDNVIIIKPTKGLASLNIREIFRYKELFFALVERDFKVRYKQTVIGVLWAVIQPLTTMVVFSFFFGKIAKIPSEGVPYPIFSFAGLILWTYFTGAITQSSNSVIGNTNLISKVYFPRLIIPLASTMVGLIDYAIALIILLGLMLYFGYIPTINIILLPFILFITWILAAGLGFWFSSTNVLFRDVKFLIGFIIQLWLYATPVIYPLSVAGQFEWLVKLNPMTGLIETHRAIFLGVSSLQLGLLAFSAVISIIVFWTGLIYFKSMEKRFADVI